MSEYSHAGPTVVGRGVRVKRGLVLLGALIATIASATAAFADTPDPTQTTTSTTGLPSTTTTTMSTSEPPLGVGSSTTIGPSTTVAQPTVGQPPLDQPVTTGGTPTADQMTSTSIVLSHVTMTTLANFPFTAPFEEPTTTVPTGPAELVAFRSPGVGNIRTPSTTAPAQAVAHGSEIAASLPTGTDPGGGLSLFWPVVLGLGCLLLLGGPVATRRLRRTLRHDVD